MKHWKIGLITSALWVPAIYCAQAQVSGNSRYPGSELSNSPARQTSNYIHLNHSIKNFVGTEELRSPPVPGENDIVVSVSGIYNVLPDEYVATFNIIQAGESAELTDQLMNTRLDSFKQGIKSTGVKEEDVYVDMLSFIPKYEYELERKVFSKTYNEVPSGFELQKNVSIRYKEPPTLDKLISVAARSEIYDLVKVDCFIQNLQPYKDSLKAHCLNEIRAKIKFYEGLDIRLDTLKKTIAERFDQLYPQNRYANYIAFSRPLPPAGKKNFPLAHENEKAVSQYYNPLEYNAFDIILNPTILEPPIQIVYSLAARYSFIKDQKQPEKHYFIAPLTETTKPVR